MRCGEQWLTCVSLGASFPIGNNTPGHGRAWALPHIPSSQNRPWQPLGAVGSASLPTEQIPLLDAGAGRGSGWVRPGDGSWGSGGEARGRGWGGGLGMERGLNQRAATGTQAGKRVLEEGVGSRGLWGSPLEEAGIQR